LRTTALLNWQMNDLKEQIRQGNVIAGQQLALAARQYYGQRLGELSQAMSQGSVR
ncbi:TPA: conjugal transfer protein, partial [Escherichia coli]